jgi:hypothetical protein
MEDSYRSRRRLYVRHTGTEFWQNPTVQHRQVSYLARRPVRTTKRCNGISVRTLNVCVSRRPALQKTIIDLESTIPRRLPDPPRPPSASDAGGVDLRGCRRHKIQRLRASLSLFLCPNLRPTCPLSCRYSLASSSRNGSLPQSTFAPMQIDFPEGGQGVCYAVQFVLKSRAFLLELADYRLHQDPTHLG